VDQDSVDRIRSATFPLARRGYERREVERFLTEIADWLETGGSDEARSDLVRQDLERIGAQTSTILTQAHDAAATMREAAERDVRQQLADANRKAEAMRESAESYAEETREDADAYALKTRADANAYAEQARSEADAYAGEARTEADGDAERVRGEAETYAGRIREEADTAARELRAQAETATREATEKARGEARRIVEDAQRRRAELEQVIADLEQRRSTVVTELRRLASDVAGAAGEPASPAAAEQPGRPDADPGVDEPAREPVSTDRE
jgi:DivIVA domain-containing protein